MISDVCHGVPLKNSAVCASIAVFGLYLQWHFVYKPLIMLLITFNVTVKNKSAHISFHSEDTQLKLLNCIAIPSSNKRIKIFTSILLSYYKLGNNYANKWLNIFFWAKVRLSLKFYFGVKYKFLFSHLQASSKIESWGNHNNFFFLWEHFSMPASLHSPSLFI